MSSLLRSSKFLRCFAGTARNILVPPVRLNAKSGIVSSNSNFLSHVRFLTSQIANPNQNSNLEKSLQQLDQDVRRMGRISRKDIEEVLEEIRQTKSATSSQSLLVIRCCGNLVPEELPQVRTKLVQEIWTTLEKLKVPLDISHYNALLRVYLENEHNFSPAEFLQDLEKKGVEPNRVTYQRLVTRYCQQGDIEGATRILEFMKEKNLPVNESVFNALIMGHSQADDMDSAAGTLNVMKQAGLEPSADTYTMLLMGYAKRGEMDKILYYLAECDKKDVYLLDKDHLDIIFTLAVNGYSSLIDPVLNRVRKSAGFNQDAVNLILRLVNNGQEDVGLKILRIMPRPSRDDGEISVNQGYFLIRQLLKAKRPVESILSICKTMEKEGLNNKALPSAVEAALLQGLHDHAFQLLKALQESGRPVRQHYFWPLLCNAGKARDDNLVASVLKDMKTSFNLLASGETVRDYVIPNLTLSDHDNIIGFLKKAGVSSGTTACSLVHELLADGQISDAATVISKYRAFYSPLLLRRPLNLAYLQTGATAHYLTILHHIYEGLDRTFQGEESDVGALDRKDLAGNYILDLLSAARRKEVDLLPILQGLLERGLSISGEFAEQIQSKLGEERLTNEISSLLSRLTDSELETTRAVRTPIPFSAFAADEDTLIDRINKLTAAGQSPVVVQRALLTFYCKNQNLEKAREVYKTLGPETGPGNHALLIDAYLTAGQLDSALECYNEFKKKYDGASVDPIKTVRLIAALITQDRLEEGIKILDESQIDQQINELSFAVKASAFQALNFLAEKGDVENVQKVFDLLVSKNYVEVTNILLGPLIKVHVVRNDINAAVSKVQVFAEKYRMTPWKNELTRRLIQTEDSAALQQLTDVSSKVHGEINSLYDLVFAFVECGRVRQARKILETPGFKNRQQRLNAICERYEQEGSVAALEGLAEATRDVNHMNRSCIFDHLLSFHIKADDSDKALAVWTQMQDEDVQASDEFLIKLANFLESKGLQVPFVKPATQPPISEKKQSEPSAERVGPRVISLRNALRNKNFAEAKAIKLQLERDNIHLKSNDLSLYLEGLVQSNQLDEAFDLAVKSLKKGTKILDRHFRFLTNKLASAGEVDKLKDIGSLIDTKTKKAVSFDNKLCGAYINSGRGGDYLNLLLEEVESAKPEDVPNLLEKFPRGAISAIIEKNPEFLPKFEQIVNKFFKLGSSGPANVLWTSLFITRGLEDRADQAWEMYGLSQSPRLMFQRVLQEARETRNETLINRLINRLEGSSVSESAIALACSCAIDILVQNNKAEEALTRLKTFIEKTCLDNFNTSSLLRLKVAVEKEGKSFPYTIPTKKSKESTSSSSDDGEEKPGSSK